MRARLSTIAPNRSRLGLRLQQLLEPPREAADAVVSFQNESGIPLPVETHLGPHQVLGLIGAGGMGEVYRARDPRLGRELAIKVVLTEGPPSADRLRRFEGEARADDARSGDLGRTWRRWGTVRIGRVDSGAPLVVAGHVGPATDVAISPDLRWVASTGEDNTLRIWPMPDLSKPPLHALPHDELLAKLKSLTNLRAVRDPTSATGWKIELGPFPGWKHVPTW